MIRLAIVVEGETEKSFVDRVLAPHLIDFDVDVRPTMPGKQGGDIRIERLAPEMARLTWNFHAVTSLVDFYGFRGKSVGETVEQLEHRIDEAIGTRGSKYPCGEQLFAYVQRHEFEALLFSDVDAFSVMLEATPVAIRSLRRAAEGEGFATPEDINDHPTTAPSKRIQAAMPRYGKVRDGPVIAENIGIESMRAACPRFNDWITRLESL